MAKRPGKQIAEATAEPLTKGGEAAEKIVKGNTEVLTVSGNASRAAVQEPGPGRIRNWRPRMPRT